jgi:hypothetical protein
VHSPGSPGLSAFSRCRAAKRTWKVNRKCPVTIPEDSGHMTGNRRERELRDDRRETPGLLLLWSSHLTRNFRNLAFLFFLFYSFSILAFFPSCTPDVEPTLGSMAAQLFQVRDSGNALIVNSQPA